VPALIIVAKAVATVLVVIERAVGSTEANVVGAAAACAKFST